MHLEQGHLDPSSEPKLRHRPGAGGETPTATGLLLRLAVGETVSSDEARQCLVRDQSRRDMARLERAARIKERDAGLLAAGLTLAGDAPCLWALAGRLEAAVSRFERRMWPRLRAGLSCGDLSPCDEALSRAFLAVAGRVPRSARSFHSLLKNSL